MKQILFIGLVLFNIQVTQTSQIDTELKVTADISSRDDQTKDCLRKRRCIDVTQVK